MRDILVIEDERLEDIDIVEIYGVKYTTQFLRIFGKEPPSEALFRIKGRKDGSLTLESPDPQAMIIDMLIFCPRCTKQHVDAPDLAIDWTNPPHRSHLCLFCGHIWRIADVFTNGVKELQTRGAADLSPVPVAVTS